MLEIRLFGRFDLRFGGVPLELPSRHAQSLLAYLVLSPGTPHRREKLAGLFWPNATEANARNSLRQTVWRIRRTLAAGRTGGPDYLLADDLTITFEAGTDCWLDVAVLESKELETASADELIQTLSAYRGELLSGFYDDWIMLERERLQAVFERKMRRLLERLTTERRWGEALEWGERWIALGSVPEPAYRALMLAHAGLGDQASAATAYRRCLEALKRELGVEPSEETRALYMQLAEAKPPLAPPLAREPEAPPAGAEARPAAPVVSGPLAAMPTPPPATGQRKQVTVLFCDLVGFTAMAERMDPEDVREVLDRYFGPWRDTIARYGGVVEKFIGDAVMAVFGVPAAHEDDPERAIRTALEARERIEALNDDMQRQHGLRLAVRVGIHTGPVVADELGRAGDFSVTGDTVNLASRLQSHAPTGGLLISHDTYRHVRGVFDVTEQPPLNVKGKAGPLRTYLVERAKPRAFRALPRGVEGVETRMIGRETELQLLQDTFETAIADREFLAVTVMGEPGLGKSRLLYEFVNWIELRPERVWLFQALGHPQMSLQPYGLVRDLLASRFEIHDSDSLDLAREKLVEGVAGLMGAASEAPAHFLGHLIGLDFSWSPHLQGTLSDTKQLHTRALHSAVQFFQAIGRSDAGPVIILLDDIHWADDGSLHLLNHLAQECRSLPAVMLCAARPTLLERRPLWGSGQPFHSRMELRPLNRRDSRRLVDEILQKVAGATPALRETVAGSAEGNPFYMEELVKTLIDEGAIIAGPDAWQVEAGRMAAARVPPTLTAVLQARLDALPPDEKAALQRAAVVGNLFWDGAVAYLHRPVDLAGLEGPAGLTSNHGLLQAMAARELIFERETSAFDGTREYVFKHSLLHEVIYESVLKRQRRVYHQLAAEWLAEQSGERAGEYAGLMAGHYEKAGENALAVVYFSQAGDRAKQLTAFAEARASYERALALSGWPPPTGAEAPAADRPRLAAMLFSAGEVTDKLGDLAAAQVYLEGGLVLARAANDPRLTAALLNRMALVANLQGDYPRAQALLAEGLPLARQAGDPNTLAQVLYGLGDLHWRLSQLEEALPPLEESLALARAGSDSAVVLRVINRLGTVRQAQFQHAEARRWYAEGLALATQVSNRESQARILTNLNELERYEGNYLAARDLSLAGLKIHRELGQKHFEAMHLLDVGWAFLHLGEMAEAERHLREGLALALATGSMPRVAEGVIAFAHLRARAGDVEGALALLGLAMAHPAHDTAAPRAAEAVLAELRSSQPDLADLTLEDLPRYAQGLVFEEVVKELVQT